MTRNITLIVLLLLGLAVAFVGCDTGENDPIDEDLVGTWNASTASVILSGVSVPVFEAGETGELSVTFGSGGAFTFVADGPIEIDPPIGESVEILATGEGATISGTYAFAAGDGAVTFTPTEVDGEPITNVPATPVPITFEDSDTIVLTVENTPEGRALLGFLLGEQIPQEVIDNIDGGQVTFRSAS